MLVSVCFLHLLVLLFFTLEIWNMDSVELQSNCDGIPCMFHAPVSTICMFHAPVSTFLFELLM